MNQSLQVWSDFFDELDQETIARQQLAMHLRSVSSEEYKTLSADWLSSLRQIRLKKSLRVSEFDTLLPSSMEKQSSLQSCLTQALCILDEVKDMPGVPSMDTRFGDFGTLLGLLEEANSHLHTLMTE